MPEVRGTVDIINEMARRINDMIRRVRVLEERLRNLDLRVNNLDQMFINEIKAMHKTVAENSDSIKLVQDRIANMEVDISNFKRDFKKLVTKTDIREIEAYLDLIKPVTTRFVTRKEVEELVEAKISGAEMEAAGATA